VRSAYRVTADDVDVTEALRRDLIDLKVTDKPGLDSDAVTLTLADTTQRLALPRRGVRLRVAIGWDGQRLIDRGAYLVDEVRHKGPPDTIAITARAADLTGGLREQREASYHATTLGDILAVVAGRQGLAAAIAPALAGRIIGHLDQTNESDAHLVTRLAEQYDAIGSIKDGHLLFVPRGSGITANGALLPPVTVARTASVDHEFGIKDREGKTTGVKAQWRDYDGAETAHEMAGTEGSVTTLKRVYPTQTEAADAAQAALRALSRGQRSLRLRLAVGRPEIIAGQPLRVSGFRAEIDAVDWSVATVEHTVTASGGLLTRIDAEERLPPEAVS